MPGLGLGATKGLSYVNDWEKDIDRVYQREEYFAKVEQQKQQETLWFADKLKRGHGSTPYVEGKLDAFYKEHTKKIADFAINNPNFRTDVTKMQEYLNLTDQIINNPILQQDLQVKQNFERLQAAVASGQITEAKFNEEKEKYMAYANADPSTDVDPYVFTNPKQVDITKIIGEAQQITPKIKYIKQDGVTYKTYEGVDPIAVRNSANTVLSDEDNRLALQSAYKDAIEKDPNIAGTYKTLDEYTASLIEAGNKIQQIGIDWNQDYLRNLSAGGKSGIAGMYFFKSDYPRIQALKDGQSTPGSIPSLALTLYHGIDNPAVIGPTSGVQVYSNKDKRYKDLDVSLNTEAKNFISYKKIGGKLYGEITVNASPGIIKEGQKISQKVDQNNMSAIYKSESDAILSDYGFTSAEGAATGMMSVMGGSSPGKSYTGTVWVPIETSPANYAAYDKAWGGVTEVGPAFESYNNPEFQDPMKPKEYTPEERIRTKNSFVSELSKGKYPTLNYFKDITDPNMRNYLGNDFVQITINGKSEDEDGNPYIANIFTGEKGIYQK